MQKKDKEALMDAVKYRTFNHVQWYLNEPDKLQHDDESFFDYELLKAALDRKHQTIVNFLLKLGCRVRNPHKTSAEETPLHLAMKLGNNVIIRKILNNGASIYDKNTMGETALYAAYKEQRYHAISAFFNFFSSTNIKQLSNWKAPDPADKDDVIHFHIACTSNNLKAIKLYLSSGFDVNIPFSLDTPALTGLNPFQYAIMKENSIFGGMVYHFLQHNVDLSIKNHDGYTPLQMIYYAGFSNFKKYQISQIFKYGNVTKFTNYADKNNLTHFHLCCTTNDPTNVQLFIDKGVDVNGAISLNSPINPGFTPLHFAVLYENVQIVLLLLENGAHCNIADKNRSTPLHIACKKSGCESDKIIEMLLYYNACPHATDNNKVTPLIMAFNCNYAKRLRANIFDFLISRIPPNFNYSDEQNLSHWHIVCTKDDISRVIDFLLYGVAIDSCVISGEYSGYTALHFAVLYNQKDVVEVLLKWNAQVNITTSELKLTPLHLACNYNHIKYYSSEVSCYDLANLDWTSHQKNQLDIIQLLIKHGANIDAQDSLGRTPLLQALTFDNFDFSLRPYINRRLIEIIEILLSNNANLHLCQNNGKSTLHIIAQNCFLNDTDKIVECLITKGADVHAVDKAGLMPLHIAAKLKKFELISIFLKYKANVNEKSENGKIPLQLFLKNYKEYLDEDQDILLLLLESGSDINIRCAKYTTLWLDALKYSNIFLLEMLLKRGADLNMKDSLGKPLIVHVLRDWAHQTSDWTNTENAKVFRVIDQHIVKLKSINHYICEEVSKCCETLVKHFTEKTDIYRENTFFEDCNKELDRMKIIKIDNFTTMYDILLKNVHDLSKHVKNDILVKILEDQNTFNSFPLYSQLLKVQFKKALVRNSALESANISLSFISSLNLPDLCVDSILKYLTNEEIAYLKAAVPLEVRKIFKRKISNDFSTQPSTKLQKNE